jgi:MtN3 and saliva related transmembrane protein
MIEEIFGTIAFITTLIGLLPQVYKTYITKSARDLSMLMLINYCICSMAWIIYGSATESNFVIYSNYCGLITSIILIWQKLHFVKNNSQ